MSSRVVVVVVVQGGGKVAATFIRRAVLADVNRLGIKKEVPSTMFYMFLSSWVLKLCSKIQGMTHVSCMCASL